ncbi:hypothetical protein ACLKA7_010044 [Drosophila subpalustris]
MIWNGKRSSQQQQLKAEHLLTFECCRRSTGYIKCDTKANHKRSPTTEGKGEDQEHSTRARSPTPIPTAPLVEGVEILKEKVQLKRSTKGRSCEDENENEDENLCLPYQPCVASTVRTVSTVCTAS